MTTIPVWTPDLSEPFYSNVECLKSKMQATESPLPPIDYQLASAEASVTNHYTLSYDEELHLADHFAFLAHHKEGVGYVSAVAVEEMDSMLGFTIRLASNQTPEPIIIQKLEKILAIVQDHAKTGKHSESFKSAIFKEIISLSKQRIHGRLRSRQWERPLYYRSRQQEIVPLYVKIRKHLESIWKPQFSASVNLTTLRASIIQLCDALELLDSGDSEDEEKLLKVAIMKAYNISKYGGMKSLEINLREIGLPKQIYHRREVAEIDKLGKYWEICNDLIWLSRQSRTRPHFKNLRLEVCKAFEPSQPLGATKQCFVHGEVQLIVYYESNMLDTPPRALGSSKHACYLCDLFIKHSGKFGVSASHMRLATRWTIPDEEWMSEQLRQRLRDLIRAMNIDLQPLLRLTFYHQNFTLESRLHVLRDNEYSSLASSDVSLIAEELQQEPTGIGTLEINDSAPSIISEESVSDIFIYGPQDLPLAIDILPSTTLCELVAGFTTYLFDLIDVSSGKLLVESSTDNLELPLQSRVDAFELSSECGVSIKPENHSRSLTFSVHAGGQHELRISMTWNDL